MHYSAARKALIGCSCTLSSCTQMIVAALECPVSIGHQPKLACLSSILRYLQAKMIHCTAHNLPTDGLAGLSHLVHHRSNLLAEDHCWHQWCSELARCCATPTSSKCKGSMSVTEFPTFLMLPALLSHAAALYPKKRSFLSSQVRRKILC